MYIQRPLLLFPSALPPPLPSSSMYTQASAHRLLVPPSPSCLFLPREWWWAGRGERFKVSWSPYPSHAHTPNEWSSRPPIVDALMNEWTGGSFDTKEAASLSSHSGEGVAVAEGAALPKCSRPQSLRRVNKAVFDTNGITDKHAYTHARR